MEGSEPHPKQEESTDLSDLRNGELKEHESKGTNKPKKIDTSLQDATDSGDITDIRPISPANHRSRRAQENGEDASSTSVPLEKGKGKGKEKEEKEDEEPETPPQFSPSPIKVRQSFGVPLSPSTTRQSVGAHQFSEWSHQQGVPQKDGVPEDDDELGWQEMPAYASYDIYDDNNKLIAREREDSDEEDGVYAGLGGAGKGYTRVQVDEDAKSATSLDENTAYLFKDANAPVDDIEDFDNLRDPMEQLQANKTLLNDNQRIAYVGVVRLAMADMLKNLSTTERTRASKKNVEAASEAMTLWSQKIMVRIYGHMELDPAEQVMIEQLAEHGLKAEDLTPSLMENARVKNPAAEEEEEAKDQNAEAEGSNSKTEQTVDGKADESNSADIGPPAYDAYEPKAKISRAVEAAEEKKDSLANGSERRDSDTRTISPAPPPYEEPQNGEVPEAQALSEMPTTSKIDIDLRWTVLCDLFLILIADGSYDARSRFLLEQVGNFLSISWLDIRRFEKRVTEALEMAEAADKETWNEADHMEARRKKALKRRLMMMGLATVGGGLVIGLSAGLLAPVIGAGLAAGFTTIGVTGTSGFLAGAGGAAVIGTGSAIAGGTIGVRAANRRTGAVKTFEYRPLFNNKRVNLIVTVSGWMSSKVDDVRLPFSTVDPVMGDIYSILWEPDMLQSMGDTINILASEALTQTLQQILGATILVSLMAALQLPVVLSKLSYLIDNPWSVSLARADLAGLILADSIMDRNLGNRPITLVGYSLGSRLIISCLKELANRGAYGLVHNVFLFGSPMVVKKDDYLRMRTVASGRFVNGYATNDWILGYLFRATGGGISRVAGLAKVDLPGIENVNCTEWVPGHMAYRNAMPKLLKNIGFAITSEEFTEIEDPDPENHDKRQRELVNEIEEARKEIAQKPEKRRWGIFKRQKFAQKKEWETYDERMKAKDEEDPEKIVNEANPNAVLFDISAIQKEVAALAAEGIEVKELESTQPALRIESPVIPSSSGTSSPRGNANLRETRSYEGDIHLPYRPTISGSRSYTQSEAAESEGKVSMSFEPTPNHTSKTLSHQGIYEDDHQDEITMSFEPSDSFASPYEGNKKFFKSRVPDHGDDDEVTMTFDMPHERNLTGLPLRANNSSPYKVSLDSPRLAAPEPTKSRTPSPQHSPSFKPPPQAPAQQSQSDINPSHNVWADLDDEEFGKEKDEPELTFA